MAKHQMPEPGSSYSTSSNATSPCTCTQCPCSYTAARYPAWQERVREELRGAVASGAGEAAGAGALGPDALARLPLLNALISETMRLYPTAATAGSRCVVWPVVLFHARCRSKRDL